MTPDMSDPDDDQLFDLDFTKPGAIPVEEEAQAKPAPPPSLSSVPAVLEEVARLHGDARTDEACRQLEEVLHHEDFGDCRELAWCMMFDLYLSLGRRQAFEALAIGYAGKLEKSPPTWTEPAEDAPSLGHDGLATVTLSGALGSNAVQPLAKLCEMAGKVEGVRLDLAKVHDADDIGCAALLETLRFFKKLKKACILVGGEKIVVTLAAKTVMGERTHEATWLLLLELYQNLNRPDEFDETAVGYAVTFEVSPPSFEVPKAAAPVPKKPPPAVAAAARAAEGFALSGELAGAQREHFAPLLAYASSHDPVVIDCSGLKRMDEACAAEFGKVLGELKSFGRGLRIRGANCLLIALWRSLGLDRIAQIEARKL
jgi:ABC-type transporter Mla MlaB component